MSNYRVIFSDEMYHSRTKGSKNGIRRYQNEDGTWTELGKERRRLAEGFKKHLPYYDEEGNLTPKGERRKRQLNGAFAKNVKNGKDKPNVSQVQSIGNDVTKITKEIKSLRPESKKKKSAREEAEKRAKSMSDAEIQRYINRKRLEQQYVDIEMSSVESGKDRFDKILDTTGSLLVIASSAAGIAGSIIAIKNAGNAPKK